MAAHDHFHTRPQEGKGTQDGDARAPLSTGRLKNQPKKGAF